MVFKRLTINHFGKIGQLDISFCEQITEIASPDTDDIVKAIGLATYNKSIIDRTGESSVSYNTKIVLQLDIAGHPYSITVRGQPYGKECIYEGIDCKSNMAVDVPMLFGGVKLCEEEESLTYYRYDQKNIFSTRLLHYKDPEKYYSFGDFQRKTNGFGFTKAFRIYLKEYFKKHGACGFLRIYVKRNHARTEGLFSAVLMSPVTSPTRMSLRKRVLILAVFLKSINSGTDLKTFAI